VAKREVEICKQLDDPNILRIIDSETDPKGRPYLATEYRPRG
jgi:serine/threonine protein kinase